MGMDHICNVLRTGKNGKYRFLLSECDEGGTGSTGFCDPNATEEELETSANGLKRKERVVTGDGTIKQRSGRHQQPPQQQQRLRRA